MNIKRLAVFSSGAGSTLRAVHRAILTQSLTGIDLALVVSNNSNSGALDYARDAGLAGRHISLKMCGTEEAHCKTLVQALHEFQIDILLLAGYMKQVPAAVVTEFENRILNVHPALLPAFGGPSMYGNRVHQAVLDRGCKVTGATVHFVSQEYDAGPIVLQECCEVLEDDTIDSLRERVQAVEQRLLVDALRLMAEDRLSVIAGKVHIKDQGEA